MGGRDLECPFYFLSDLFLARYSPLVNEYYLKSVTATLVWRVTWLEVTNTTSTGHPSLLWVTLTRDIWSQWWPPPAPWRSYLIHNLPKFHLRTWGRDCPTPPKITLCDFIFFNFSTRGHKKTVEVTPNDWCDASAGTIENLKSCPACWVRNSTL